MLLSRPGVEWSGDALAGNLRWWPPICQAGQRARLDWTGDQITDLTPDAQIAGIKIQFPTAATTTRRGGTPSEKNEEGEERENRELVFVFAGLTSRGAAVPQSAAGQPSTAGTAEGGSTSCIVPFSSANGISLSLFDLIALAAKSNWIVVQFGIRD